jgi:hypothetical protein
MFENRRVYLLTGVAYMGAMLFGPSFHPSNKHHREIVKSPQLTKMARFRHRSHGLRPSNGIVQERLRPPSRQRRFLQREERLRLLQRRISPHSRILLRRHRRGFHQRKMGPAVHSHGLLRDLQCRSRLADRCTPRHRPDLRRSRHCWSGNRWLQCGHVCLRFRGCSSQDPRSHCGFVPGDAGHW